MPRYITKEERKRLEAYEKSPDSPDMRIPIPADGFYWPSDECYWNERLQLFEVEDCCYYACERAGFELNLVEV